MGSETPRYGTTDPCQPPAPQRLAEYPHTNSSVLGGSCHSPSSSSTQRIPIQGTEGASMLRLGTVLKLQATSTFEPWDQGFGPAAARGVTSGSEGIQVNKGNQSSSSQDCFLWAEHQVILYLPDFFPSGTSTYKTSATSGLRHSNIV